MIVWLKKNYVYILLFTALLIGSYVFGRCSTKKERSQQISNLIAARDSVSESFVIIGGLKQTVSIKDAIILSKDDALKAQIIENERLKALHIKDLIANAEIIGTIKILRDSLKLPGNPVYLTIKDTSGIKRNYIRIPFDLLRVHDKYIDLDAGIDSLRNAWFKLSNPVSGEMSIGYVKAGFLKQKPVGIFTTPNPYLTVNSMDILIIKEDKHFYNKTWFHMLAGAVLVEGTRILLLK